MIQFYNIKLNIKYNKQNNENILLFSNELEFNSFEKIDGLVPFKVICANSSHHMGIYKLYDSQPILCTIGGKIVFADFIYNIDHSEVSYYDETIYKFNYKNEILSHMTDVKYVLNLKEIKDGKEITIFSDLDDFDDSDINVLRFRGNCGTFIISIYSGESYTPVMQNYHMNVVHKYNTDHEMVELLAYNDYYSVVVKQCSDNENKIYASYVDLKLIDYVKLNMKYLNFPDDTKIIRKDKMNEWTNYRIVYGYFKY